MQTLTRKSVPVDGDELAVARAVLEDGTPERAAIEALSGPLPGRISEAQALATMLALGAQQVREAVIHAGYAAYAATLDDEDRRHAAVVRSRRSRLTD